MKLNTSETLAVCEVTSAEVASRLLAAKQEVKAGRYGAALFRIEQAEAHTSNLREAVARGLKAEQEAATCVA